MYLFINFFFILVNLWEKWTCRNFSFKNRDEAGLVCGNGNNLHKKHGNLNGTEVEAQMNGWILHPLKLRARDVVWVYCERVGLWLLALFCSLAV